MSGGRLEAFFTVPSGTTMSATTTSGGPTSIPITAGSYTPTSYCALVQAQLNATRTPALWVVTLSTTTGLVTINNPGTTWALTFTTALSGTVMGFVGNISSGSTARTGTQNARGLFVPDSPPLVDGDPDRAPKQTDARSVEGPYGAVTTYKSTRLYAHARLRFTHLSRAKVWEGETATYASLQQWIDDTQLAEGHGWFSCGSAFQAYWDNAGTDRIVGRDLNAGAGPANGWKFSPAVADYESHIKPVSTPWLGIWSAEFSRIVSTG